MTEHRIWFDQPAAQWEEALPLGNGRTGAMLFGRIDNERVLLNDSTAWSGNPSAASAEPQIHPERAREILAETRSLLNRGDYAAATETLRQLQHRHSQTFLPLGEVDIAIGGVDEHANYWRELDLRSGTHRTSSVTSRSTTGTKTFVSFADGVIVHRIVNESSDGAAMKVTTESLLRTVATTSPAAGILHRLLQMPADVYPSHDAVAEPVIYADGAAAGMQGAIAIRWEHDGVEVIGDEYALEARRVHHATIVIATETTWTGMTSQPSGTAHDAAVRAQKRLDRALLLGYDTLLRRHTNAHRELYGRVELDFASEAVDIATVTTAERLRRVNAANCDVLAVDPGLAALLFHYGRYLLISSSRAGSPPANLQGLWNHELQPPWSSNYTTNINVQMNYWMAESANLPETLPPLFDLIDALEVTGTATARRLYDAPGWAAHHNTDVWAYSLPVGAGSHDPKWAAWPMAGPWLIRHLWERVLHGADDDFIRDRAWSPTRGAAEFVLAWLQTMPDGTLGTSPSTSPENAFLTPNGDVAQVATSSAFDLAVVRDLFEILNALALRLGRADDPIVRASSTALQRLRSPHIAPNGSIAEWDTDFTYPDPHHRHLSPLYFVHPSDWALDATTHTAVVRTLDDRGDESTGWSLAWKMLQRARTRQGNKVADLLRLMFRDMTVDRGHWVGGLYPNLFAAHPPFQIDGNLGYVAAIVETLMQSHHGVIDLLPAVPRGMPSGRVEGLVARPGVNVALDWTLDAAGEHVLNEACLRPIADSASGHVKVRYRDEVIVVALTAGFTTRIVAESFPAGRSDYPRAGSERRARPRDSTGGSF